MSLCIGLDQVATPVPLQAVLAKPPPAPLLTVIIPLFNEAPTVDELVQRVLDVPIEKQVIVVDDGSTDGGAVLLEKWRASATVLLLSHASNRGKGAAIRSALEHAVGRFTIVQDADLEYDPREYLKLIDILKAGDSDVVLGSRYFDGSQGANLFFRFGVGVLNLVVKLLYGVKLSDEATCYKVTSTSILRQMALRCERFEFC